MGINTWRMQVGITGPYMHVGGAHVGRHAHGGQRLTSRVFSDYSSPYLLKQHLSLHPELAGKKSIFFHSLER